MKNLLLIFISVLLGASGQVLMKKGMQVFGIVTLDNVWSQLVRIFLVPYIAIGFLCFGISAILWLVVISKAELSYAYPLVSFGYVIVVLSSWIFFKEDISLARLAGLAFICLGVSLVSVS